MPDAFVFGLTKLRDLITYGTRLFNPVAGKPQRRAIKLHDLINYFDNRNYAGIVPAALDSITVVPSGAVRSVHLALERRCRMRSVRRFFGGRENLGCLPGGSEPCSNLEVNMKMVKSLILGSAAGLVAMSGAQAADLPVKAKAVEYVKICSLYGAGFFYIPGSDTCIKLGGYLRVDTTINGSNHGQPAWSGDLGQG